MKKIDIRKLAQERLQAFFGFCPTIKEIVLLECAMDGTYIMIDVNGKQYQITEYKVCCYDNDFEIV